jgi:L,D-peptidoglycan transpeptidase YkuD (ErfK/YbiS/YcfS/YnhG family)
MRTARGPAVALALVALAAAVPPAAVAKHKAPDVSPNGMRGLGDAARVIEISAWSEHTTYATARTYRKRKGRWEKVKPGMQARIGRNGLSKHRHQGDGTTPVGNFGFVYDFGSRSDPGVTAFKWRELVPGSCWSGSRNHYNRWVHRSPCGQSDENLWASASPEYRYASVIDFNYRHPVYGRGAGIFLHVQAGRATAGCVALDESDLVPILRWMRPGTRILIGTADYLRSLKS